MNTRTLHQRGMIQPMTIMVVVMSILFLAAGGLAVWAYIEYDKARTDVDRQIATAVAEAQKEQAELDEEKFAQREKEPNRQFVGPNDYGRVTFDYPKTWSVYVNESAADGKSTYEAYLSPITVPPVRDKESRFALRVTIEDKAYAEVVDSYSNDVEKGELKSRGASAKGQQGTRLDGKFDKDLRGAAVIFKIRDKTLTIRTDADTFKPDFDKLVETIEFSV
ncbi:hypothetical protein CR983_03065 [Candidatus Saccharibacteria bacterium]|nr:MAG: hypothetical protein CR983_03065 [Candidatus Saccharibacteria bacterium]